MIPTVVPRILRTASWRALSFVFVVLAIAACGDRPKPPSKNPQPAASSPIPAERPAIKPAIVGDWALYLGNVAQSGESTDSKLKPPLTLAWRYETSGSVSANPIVVGDTVYVGSSDRRFFALHATQWGERWRFLAKAPILQAAAYGDGVVVFADAKANLYALNGENGKLLWTVTLDGWTVSPPVFVGGTVWVGIHPNRIIGFDPSSGARVGQSVRTITLGGVEYASDKGYFAPSARFAETTNGSRNGFAAIKANGLRYRCSADGTIRATNVDGKEVWKTVVGGGIAGPPAVARGLLYVPGGDGALNVYSSAANVRERTRSRVATVTVWESVARATPSPSGAVVAVLNDRSGYEFETTQAGWAQALLPNGVRAWIPPGDWAVLPTTPTDGTFYENRNVARFSKGVQLPTGAERPVWSHNGGFVAFPMRTRLSGQFWVAQEIGVWNADTGEARSVARGSFLNPNLSWSFDDKWIAFETYQHEEAYVWIVGASGRPMKRLAVGDAPMWSSSSHRIAYRRRTDAADELWRVNSDGEDAVRLLNAPIKGYVGQFAYLNPAAWHPKGISLALGADAKYYEDGRARLVTVGIAEKSSPTAIQTPAEEFREIEWSPDGLKIASVLTGHVGGSASDPLNQRVYVYWLDGSKPPFSVPHTHVTWVNAGTVAYVELSAGAGGRHRVWLHDVERRRRTLIAETTTPVAELQWVPARSALALWITSDVIRDGKRQPAETRGWLIRLTSAAS